MQMLLLGLAAATAPSVPDVTPQMAKLYEEVCLTAFPDDDAVVEFMAARHATELSPEVVKITLVDDPGRAWELADGSATVWLEFPPYHACSVRWNAPEVGDMSAYQQITGAYKRGHGEFAPLDLYETDRGDIHIKAVGEAKDLGKQGSENLFFFQQSISDPDRRAAGETGYSLRFVHQFAPQETED